MRCRSVVAAGWLAFAGCGDNKLGVPTDVMVEDLEEDEAIALCEEFVALICNDYRGYDYCNGCILYEMCYRPDLIGTMNLQCEDITVGEVRACSHKRRYDVCQTTAGGCMFDVAELMCNP
jgi:hypothetical protein